MPSGSAHAPSSHESITNGVMDSCEEGACAEPLGRHKSFVERDWLGASAAFFVAFSATPWYYSGFGRERLHPKPVSLGYQLFELRQRCSGLPFFDGGFREVQ